MINLSDYLVEVSSERFQWHTALGKNEHL